MIEFKNIDVILGAKKVLDGVSVSINSGENTAIVGSLNETS